MAKNIILCCDGTSNQFAGDQTNVIRLYRCAPSIPGQQVTFYDPGVGTMPAPGLPTRVAKRISVSLGLAIGLGFTDNIRDAYCFLMQEFEPGDQVFLFGFSRGAFTARALAGMLHAVGLLHPGTENLVPYAIRYWRNCYTSAGSKVAADFKRTMSRECKPHFIGLWDTVGSVGWFNNFQTFPHTRHNPDVAIVRHAVSIDERRCCFRHNLVEVDRNNSKQDVQNVWFAGVHADVGGGYPEAESGLSKIALEWIAREAKAAGMIVEDNILAVQLGARPDPAGTQHSPPSPAGMLHQSLHGFWWVLELLPRRQWHPADHRMHWSWGPNRPRRMPSQPLLHPSVLERERLDPRYHPCNLEGLPDTVAQSLSPS